MLGFLKQAICGGSRPLCIQWGEGCRLVPQVPKCWAVLGSALTSALELHIHCTHTLHILHTTYCNTTYYILHSHIHYTTLHYTTLHYTTLHYTTLHILLHTTTHPIVSQINQCLGTTWAKQLELQCHTANAQLMPIDSFN